MDQPMDVLGLVLRWVHLVAGVAWIGLLYYFNLVQVPFMKETDPGTKSGVVQKLLPRALFWFRWAAVATVVAGLMLMMVKGLHNWQIRIGAALGLIMFFNVWVIIWPNQKKGNRHDNGGRRHKDASAAGDGPARADGISGLPHQLFPFLPYASFHGGVVASVLARAAA